MDCGYAGIRCGDWNPKPESGVGPVGSDSLVYSYRGLMEGFLHHEYSGASVMGTSEWRYRYSAGGEREQKRLYLQQDSLHNVIEHNSWVYYALGGKKEQLAVYHGQEMAVPGCLPPGPVSVYFYPVEFLTYGNGSSANLVTLPDIGNPAGVKEFHLADHLGSTRVTINTSTGSQYADYGPDGNLLAGGASVREGYIGKELGRESGLLNCGVREKFEWGFNSPDPLWEKSRSWSPYLYSLANPLRWRDPNGLEVDVSGMMSYETTTQGHKVTTLWANELVDELQQITGMTLYIDNGCLKVDYSQKITGGSATAREMLLEMINSESTLHLKVSEDVNGTSLLNPDCNVITYSPKQMTKFMNGVVGLPRLTMGWGMTLFHEYLHTPMGGRFLDPPKGDRWGNVDWPDVKANLIRSELGSGMGSRVSFDPKDINGTSYMPFTREAFQLLNKGVVPESGYIQFKSEKANEKNDENRSVSANIVAILPAILLLSCSVTNTAKLACSWERDVYNAALQVIVADTANITNYFVESRRLTVAVWDTAVAFDGVDYRDMDYAPESCVPDQSDNATFAPRTYPCRSFSVVGLSELSNSESPDFLVKFGRIDSSYGKGGFIVKAMLWPVDDKTLAKGKTRDYFDMIGYVFCFDRAGKIRAVKRIDPEE